MATELCKSGLSVVGDMPWGTHFCQFYATKQDLLDSLVPYFKAGLEHGEFCLWVTSPPLTAEEARGALQDAVLDLNRYLAENSIEIVPHDVWYLNHGGFDPDRVINGWMQKLDQALARGYAGMRVSGNTTWIQKQDWQDFQTYEQAIDKAMDNQRMVILCTYPLATSGAAEILDAAHTHEFAVALRHGNWEVVETPRLKQAKQEISRLNEELEQRVIERTRELAAANQELRREITERKRAEEESRRHTARMEALVDISQALAEVGLDVQIVLETIARQTAAVIGDACVITLLLDDEPRLQPVAFHHPDPEVKTLMAEVLSSASGYTDNGLFSQIMRTGQPALIPVVPQEQLRQMIAPQHWPYLERAGIHSLLVVALRLQGQIIGTLGVTRDAPGRPYTVHDQAFLLDLADRAALTLQNARLFEQVQGAHERLQALSRRLLRVQEDERHHLARELHDEIGQQLTGVNLMLTSDPHHSHDQAQARMARAQALVRDLIELVRNLALDLRPAMLDDFGLVPALIWLLERYMMQTHVTVRFEHPGLEGQRFAPEVEISAYRIVQEALTNVARHAGVPEVTVRLWMDDDTLFVMIADQGDGFEPETIHTSASNGLAGMQERAALLGGNLTIKAAPGLGTLLNAALPLHDGAGPCQQESNR